MAIARIPVIFLFIVHLLQVFVEGQILCSCPNSSPRTSLSKLIASDPRIGELISKAKSQKLRTSQDCKCGNKEISFEIQSSKPQQTGIGIQDYLKLKQQQQAFNLPLNSQPLSVDIFPPLGIQNRELSQPLNHQQLIGLHQAANENFLESLTAHSETNNWQPVNQQSLSFLPSQELLKSTLNLQQLPFEQQCTNSIPIDSSQLLGQQGYIISESPLASSPVANGKTQGLISQNSQGIHISNLGPSSSIPSVESNSCQNSFINQVPLNAPASFCNLPTSVSHGSQNANVVSISPTHIPTDFSSNNLPQSNTIFIPLNSQAFIASQTNAPIEFELSQNPNSNQVIETRQPVQMQQPQSHIQIQQPIQTQQPLQIQQLIQSEQPLQIEQPIQSQQPLQIQQPIQPQKPNQMQQPIQSQQYLQMQRPNQNQQPLQIQESIQNQQYNQMQQQVRTQQSNQQPIQIQQQVQAHQPFSTEQLFEKRQQQSIQIQPPNQMRQQIQTQQPNQMQQPTQIEAPIHMQQSTQIQEPIQTRQVTETQHLMQVQQPVQSQQPGQSQYVQSQSSQVTNAPRQPIELQLVPPSTAPAQSNSDQPAAVQLSLPASSNQAAIPLDQCQPSQRNQHPSFNPIISAQLQSSGSSPPYSSSPQIYTTKSGSKSSSMKALLPLLLNLLKDKSGGCGCPSNCNCGCMNNYGHIPDNQRNMNPFNNYNNMWANQATCTDDDDEEEEEDEEEEDDDESTVNVGNNIPQVSDSYASQIKYGLPTEKEISQNCIESAEIVTSKSKIGPKKVQEKKKYFSKDYHNQKKIKNESQEEEGDDYESYENED